MTSSDHRVPVLIIGGGPVGLGLACELGWRGVECMLIEQSDGTISHPRANAENARTMEACRRWGVTDAVRSAATPSDFPHTVIYATSMRGKELARIERPTHGGKVGHASGGGDGGKQPASSSPERPQRCNQMWFDPILANRARQFPSVTMKYRWRLNGFVDTGEGVLADVTDLGSGRSVKIAARYMVACCGGRSPVRKTLGVPLEGEKSLGFPINIFFRSPELWRHHDMGKIAMSFLIGPEGLWGNLTALDGREQWRLTLQGTSSYRDPATVDVKAEIARAIGCEVPFELISCLSWVRRDMVAARFVYGNVLLAGDCIHQHSPAGGFGLNTGFGDVLDLGWKLEASLKGWAGPHLLQSYEAERRPVAIRNVGEATANFRRQSVGETSWILDETAEGERLRAELGERLIAETKRQFLSEGIALGYIYDPSPIVCADDLPRPATQAHSYTPTTYPGSRAPHAWLEPGRSTLDLFGRGFVLMRLGATAPHASAFVPAAAGRGVPLEIVDIPQPEIARLYERRLVLVRPDGHVAWRGDAMPADAGAVIDRVRGCEGARQCEAAQ